MGLVTLLIYLIVAGAIVLWAVGVLSWPWGPCVTIYRLRCPGGRLLRFSIHRLPSSTACDLPLDEAARVTVQAMTLCS